MMYMVKYWDGEQDCTEVVNGIQLDTMKHDWAIVIDSIEAINL